MMYLLWKAVALLLSEMKSSGEQTTEEDAHSIDDSISWVMGLMKPAL